MDNQVIGAGTRSLRTTILAYAGIALGIYFAFSASPTLWRMVGNGKGASDAVKIALILAIYLFFLLFVWIGYYLLKVSPKVTYYQDGFVVGKGEKVPYTNLTYFFVAGTRPNTFSMIFYKDKGKLNKLYALAYARKAFELLQNKVVEANFSTLFDKIEKGETVSFRAMKPRIGKTIKQFDEKADITISVSKNELAINDEVYPWQDYAISSLFAGTVVVSDLATNKRVANINERFFVEMPNLLIALIKTIGGR